MKKNEKLIVSNCQLKLIIIQANFCQCKTLVSQKVVYEILIFIVYVFVRVEVCRQSAEGCSSGAGSSGAAKEGGAGWRHGDVSRNLSHCCSSGRNALQVGHNDLYASSISH